jgi:hypothetical protein
MLTYGGAILAMAVLALGLTRNDDLGLPQPVAAPVSTTEATPATVPPTLPPSTTTSSTTTTTTTSTTSTTTTTTTTLPPPLVDETFDGSTTATPLYGPSAVEVEVNADAQLRITALAAGVIPVMYPDPLPSRVEITYDFFPQPVSPDGFPGVVVLADDPADGPLDYYVLVLTTQANRNLTFLVWNGEWGDPSATAIPESAGYAINQWNSMRLVLDGGAVDAYVNGVYVASLTDAAPAQTGYWGPSIIGSSTAGETVLIDNVMVVNTE